MEHNGETDAAVTPEIVTPPTVLRLSMLFELSAGTEVILWPPLPEPALRAAS